MSAARQVRVPTPEQFAGQAISRCSGAYFRAGLAEGEAQTHAHEAMAAAVAGDWGRAHWLAREAAAQDARFQAFCETVGSARRCFRTFRAYHSTRAAQA